MPYEAGSKEQNFSKLLGSPKTITPFDDNLQEAYTDKEMGEGIIIDK